MPVEKGDFILVDYVTKVEETGEIFDTTLKETAQSSGIFKGDASYEPMLIVVGENWVLRELDQALIGLDVDAPSVITIPPEKAFGLRDPSKIRLMPIRRFRNQRVNLTPGAQIEVDGTLAVVRSVGSGRVQLDFNPPLAGKTLIYELTVKSKLDGLEEKILALLHRRIPAVDVAKFKVQIRARAREKEVIIEPPTEAYYLDGVQYAKRGLAGDIQRFFPQFEKITFVERFIQAAPLADEAPPAPAGAPADTPPDPAVPEASPDPPS